MKNILFTGAFVILAFYGNAQCTTNNATSCRCKDSTQTDCDLLPDIQIGHPPFFDYVTTFGVLEFSQSGNGVNDGRLKVTVSTPNTGFGPLEIRTTNIFVCGTDTIVGTPPTICPDGISYPRIQINQRIYHKSGNVMTHYDRPAGTMTYHPSHSHMHVDNWGNYTLRVRDTTEANPLLWPMIGAGTKLAFCVEDYGTCQDYPDHCLDSSGASLNNSSDFPNYGLGGGGYTCSNSTQGISSGYVDIYWTSLDGMWIDLPPGICNGDYYLVCEVDPNQNFLEEDESNNVYAVPFTLTKQVDTLSSLPLTVSISSNGLQLCPGESVTLTVDNPMPDLTYNWSTNETTKSIVVNSSGIYSVSVNSQCGSASSTSVQVDMLVAPIVPVGTNDTIILPGSAQLNASSPTDINWYDQPSGGNLLYTGSNFNTPFLDSTTTFYAEATETFPGTSFSTGLLDSTAGIMGGYFNGDQSLIFDCYNPFILHSVKVYSTFSGTMNVELRRPSGSLVTSVPVSVVAGENVLVIDLPVSPGNNYYLTRNTGNLFRNNPNSPIGYPMNIGNLCSIKSSTAGDNFYYFFYDWNIKLPDHTCSSPRTAVQAVVLNPTAITNVTNINSLNVYPNPAENAVVVTFTSTDHAATIELTDALGKVCLRKRVLASGIQFEETLDLSAIHSGIYTLHIVSAGKNRVIKLIVE